MNRKATFSPKTPKKNSSDHNSRKEIPKYLIETDPNFTGNYYERIDPYEDDEQFKNLAKEIYNKQFIERTGQNQKMQKKQVEALLKEVVISTEGQHTKKDIIELFDMLKREKAEENHQQKAMKENRLKPHIYLDVYKLPKKLKVKRKTKKENLDETGYHILELAGHADEGHFIRKGKWDGLSYYPGRDIVMKEDGAWYIKSNELNESKEEEVFDIPADMSEFEKVYNHHWHVKYIDFNIETGLSARFSKGEISGEGRLKKVAEYLGLRYVPEEKIPLEQGVKSIKEQHHIDRQNKYTQLMLKFEHLEQQQQKDEKVEKIEQHLAKQVSSKHEQKRNTFEMQNSLNFFIKLFWILNNQILDLQEIIANKVGEITSLGSKIEDIEEQGKELNSKYEAKVNEITKKEVENTDAKIAYEELQEKFEDKINEIVNLTAEIEVAKKEYRELYTKYDKEFNESIQTEATLSQVEFAYDELKEKFNTFETKNKELYQLSYSDKDGYKDGIKTGNKLSYKRLLEIGTKKLNDLKSELNKKDESISNLEKEVFTGQEYPVEFDENDMPVKFEKETWKELANGLRDDIYQQYLQIEGLSNQSDELESQAYFLVESEYTNERGETEVEKVFYKDEYLKNKEEVVNLEEALLKIRDYKIPDIALKGTIEEIKEKVLNGIWQRKIKSTSTNTKSSGETIKFKM
jgi:hypothetical protein